MISSYQTTHAALFRSLHRSQSCSNSLYSGGIVAMPRAFGSAHAGHRTSSVRCVTTEKCQVNVGWNPFYTEYIFITVLLMCNWQTKSCMYSVWTIWCATFPPQYTYTDTCTHQHTLTHINTITRKVVCWRCLHKWMHRSLSFSFLSHDPLYPTLTLSLIQSRGWPWISAFKYWDCRYVPRLSSGKF